MPKMTLKCQSFRPFQKNTLRGFAEIHVQDMALTIKDVALHEKNNSRWAALPAKPMLKDGTIMKDAEGKAQYANIMEFSSRDVRDAFSAAVVKAVLEHTPTAFQDDLTLRGAKKPAASSNFYDDQIPF
jgi:hypothetical protein